MLSRVTNSTAIPEAKPPDKGPDRQNACGKATNTANLAGQVRYWRFSRRDALNVAMPPIDPVQKSKIQLNNFYAFTANG
jgi:hypothetical protein